MQGTIEESGEGHASSCPSCNSTKVWTDYDAGEVVCMNCGLVLSTNVRSETNFEESVGRGAEIPHIHDKNLPTTFNASDVKRDPEAYDRYRRLEYLNKTAPPRRDSAVKYRLAKYMRPILEKLPLLFSASHGRGGTDPVGQCLDFASRLVVKKKPPQEPLLYNGLALVSVLHSDPTRLLQLSFDDWINQVASTSKLTLTNRIAMRKSQDGLWTGRHSFDEKAAKTLVGDLVNVTASLSYKSHQFTLRVPVTLCLNVVGKIPSAITYKKLADGPGVVLWVSKSKIRLGESFQVRVRAIPPPKTVELRLTRLYFESGQKAAVLKRTYARLCREYGLPLDSGTPELFIDADRSLSTVDRERCLTLAAVIRDLIVTLPGYTHASPRIVAGVSVVQVTHESVKAIAERYNIKSPKALEEAITALERKQLMNSDRSHSYA